MDSPPVETPSPEPTATPTPTATATPSPGDPVSQMTAFINTSIVGVYGPSSPWLNTAWNYLQTSGTTLVEDLSSGIAGTVSVSCSWSSVSLGQCGNTTMRIDVAHTTNIDVIIHAPTSEIVVSESAENTQHSTVLLSDIDADSFMFT